MGKFIGTMRWRQIAGAAMSACLGWLIVIQPATAADPGNVTVTTTYWPPYTGLSLPRKGASTHIVSKAFDAVGISTNVQELPWKRAISTARHSNAVAYYPGYHCNHMEGFIASDPIGTGPLGLAERKEKSIQWRTVGELAEMNIRIGTVLGYSNTTEFDERAKAGELKVLPAKDDVTNLRKLIRGRIDVAVIDKLVLSYLVASDPTLKSAADSLQFNKTPLEMKVLHLCFNDSEEGRALRSKFNQGLKSVDIEAVIADYFATEF